MGDLAPVRYVTIDLWNTLLRDTDELGRRRHEARFMALSAAFTHLGWEISDERLQAAYDQCGEEHAAIQHTGRDLSARDHVDLFLQHLWPDFTVAESARARIFDAYVYPALLAPPVPLAGAAALLTRLRAAGLKLALISNAGRTSGLILRRFLAYHGLASAFETLIFSDEVEMAKPNPAIFALALERLGGVPAESAHLGDDLVLDLLGAKQAGMRAVIVRPECPPDLGAPHRWTPDLAGVPECLGLAAGSVTLEDGARDEAPR